MKIGPRSESELSADFNPSTLSAHQMGARMSAPRWSTTTGLRGCVWTLRGVRFGRTWTLGTHSGARPGSTEVPQNQFIDFVVVEADLEYIIMRQTTETFGRCSDPWVCSRCSHLENGALFSYFLYLCLGAACGSRNIGFFREMTLSVAQCLV